MRVALLIDCANVSSHAVEGVLAEFAKHGTVNVRRAQGDWKISYLNGWVEKLPPTQYVRSSSLRTRTTRTPRTSP